MLWARNVFAVLAVASTALLGCDRTPSDLREWKPSDHRHQSEAKTDNEGEAPQVTGSAEPPLPGLDEVTIATWRRACANCHGQLGHGDGPQGTMVHARDLSDSAWQAATPDAQLTESITKGRGKMPAFQLPASTVEGLVHLVRLFDRERLARAAASARAASTASSGAPAAPGSAGGHAAQAHESAEPRAGAHQSPTAGNAGAE
ncbi:MAG TPA: cytochrome c [Polyangiaceae bacterium]|jgi:cytochrome c oxidase cbb3-type subunit 3|nr:cytochrome c [Polyangiaceae bacterium]